VLIDTDKPRLEYRFIPFAKRRLHIAYADISLSEVPSDVVRAVRAATDKIPECDLVRAELCGECTPSLVKDIDGVIHEFKDRFYYFEVKDATRLKLDRRALECDRSLKGEFIRRVLADPTLTEKERDEVICCGIAALRGEKYFDV
jgi:hypothetical protein